MIVINTFNIRDIRNKKNPYIYIYITVEAKHPVGGARSGSRMALPMATASGVNLVEELAAMTSPSRHVGAGASAGAVRMSHGG